MLSKAKPKQIRVLEARGPSDVYIPSVKPRPGGEGRVVLRTQVGILSGKDPGSAAVPFLEEGSCFRAFKDSEFGLRLPFSGSST